MEINGLGTLANTVKGEACCGEMVPTLARDKMRKMRTTDLSSS
jgi:hypothetical protein